MDMANRSQTGKMLIITKEQKNTITQKMIGLTGIATRGDDPAIMTTIALTAK
jgi:hypothetical protein